MGGVLYCWSRQSAPGVAKGERKGGKEKVVEQLPLWATGAHLCWGPVRNHVAHIPELIHRGERRSEHFSPGRRRSSTSGSGAVGWAGPQLVHSKPVAVSVHGAVRYSRRGTELGAEQESRSDHDAPSLLWSDPLMPALGLLCYCHFKVVTGCNFQKTLKIQLGGWAPSPRCSLSQGRIPYSLSLSSPASSRCPFPSASTSTGRSCFVSRTTRPSSLSSWALVTLFLSGPHCLNHPSAVIRRHRSPKGYSREPPKFQTSSPLPPLGSGKSNSSG